VTSRAGFTVGSLRGQPQGARPTAPRSIRTTMMPAVLERPRRCCGSGCADCPIGRRIRALRAGLPIV
jgi:hypothetical protein